MQKTTDVQDMFWNQTNLALFREEMEIASNQLQIDTVSA